MIYRNGLVVLAGAVLFAAVGTASLSCSGSSGGGTGGGSGHSSGGGSATGGGGSATGGGGGSATGGGGSATGGGGSATGGGGSATGGGGSATGGGGSATGGGGSATGGGGSATGGGGAAGGGDGGVACTNLKVKNALVWCNVRIGANAPTSAAEQTLCVAPGAVTVAAAPLAGFQLGVAPWHGTDGDTGAGEAGTRTGDEAVATVTVGGVPRCVWVCCEFSGGGGCPTTNQCP